tara:strand:- start:6899 stop:8605 length:1707 start_codon:yes stop_codon:yes gene_type:complete
MSTQTTQTNKPKDYITESKAKRLLSQWGKLLDVESDTVKPIKGYRNRLNASMLLENQMNALNESTMSAGGGGVFDSGAGINSSRADGRSDSNYAPGDNRLARVLIPMVRRTYPELITNEIVGVQPMDGPVGLAYAIRYEYDGDVLSRGTDRRDIDGAPSYTPIAGGNPGTRDVSHIAGDAGKEAGYQYLNSAHSGVDGSAELVEGTYTLDSFGDVVVAFEGLATDAFVIVNTVTGAIRTNATDNSATNEIGWQEGEVVPAAVGGYSRKAITSLSGIDLATQDMGLGEFLSNYEATGDIPTMSVKFRKTAVEATTRRFAATWSLELEQDLKHQNGLDIDQEIVGAMSYELQAEIDREIIVRMLVACAKGGQVSTWAPQEADARYHMERSRDLYHRILVEANRISARNRRGAANFLVATPRVLAILESLQEFKFIDTVGTIDTSPTGVAKIGTLAGRFNVYRDTRSEVQATAHYGDQGYTGRTDPTKTFEYVLLGYKGSEYYDTGIIFCPYIPVMVQRVQAPNDFTPRIGLMSRYGIVDNIFGADLYYHTIVVKGLGEGFDPATGTVKYF